MSDADLLFVKAYLSETKTASSLGIVYDNLRYLKEGFRKQNFKFLFIAQNPKYFTETNIKGKKGIRALIGLGGASRANIATVAEAFMGSELEKYAMSSGKLILVSISPDKYTVASAGHVILDRNGARGITRLSDI